MTRAVAKAIEDKDFEKAMSYRDPEFCESLDGFIATSSLDHTKKLSKEKVWIFPARSFRILTESVAFRE